MAGGGEASDHLGELLTLLCCAGNGFCCSWDRQQVLEGGIVRVNASTSSRHVSSREHWHCQLRWEPMARDHFESQKFLE
jgi:hypothetical protein